MTFFLVFLFLFSVWLCNKVSTGILKYNFRNGPTLHILFLVISHTAVVGDLCFSRCSLITLLAQIYIENQSLENL